MFDELIRVARAENSYTFSEVKTFLERSSWTYRPELQGATARIFTKEVEGNGPELMKLFLQQTVTRPIRLAAFQREVSAFRDCRDYDLSGFPIYTSEGTVMGRFFLVMPYIKGENLEHAMWKEDFSPQEVEKYLPRLARDVGGAHNIGLVHRDIKPANLVLGPGGIVIVDLGLMVNYINIGLNNIFTRGMLVGTPGSMSPEQIKLQSVSPRSDVYSLGTVMYHMYSGANPFIEGAGFDLFRIMQRQKDPKRQPEPLADVSNVSVGISDLVMSCLAINPMLRPADGMALSRALEKVL